MKNIQAAHSGRSPVIHQGTGVSQRLRIAIGVLSLALAVLLVPSGASPSDLKGVKIGVVNINQALNESEAGKRSKNLLLAAQKQKENELKGKEEHLTKLSEELQNSMMLSDEARRSKEMELREKERALRQEVQRAQQELQEQERKLTESIFAELKTVLAEIAREEKFDIVLEQNASQVILFHSEPFTDLTDKVIERYNKLASAK
ncbi:MAG: OmpH family outer membrane protein [Deltaproteobacteria bacterium]|nr:OmpH family outer membrane protein [Deltaproteobacteria bacterium]